MSLYDIQFQPIISDISKYFGNDINISKKENSGKNLFDETQLIWASTYRYVRCSNKKLYESSWNILLVRSRSYSMKSFSNLLCVKEGGEK